MDIIFERDKSLKQLNTFGVEAFAKYYAKVETEDQLISLLQKADIMTSVFVLGGGSNVLFTKDYDGLVLQIKIGGIQSKTDGTDVYVTAGGGVVWNDLVQYCVSHNFAGIENLSLIPGSVGAAPVQNIGAYGVELMDVFHSCRAYDLVNHTMVEFDREACEFSYRDSFFKRKGKDKYIITEITLKLSTIPTLKKEYGAIQSELERRNISNPTIQDISEIVSEIRQSKLPDPATIGNSGSFFKNPIISLEKFEELQSTFLDIVYYPIQPDKIKLAAGWLIEQCGWKGQRIGNTGTWKNQALVLVNNGNATGLEVYEFSERIVESVFSKFGVLIEREVNIL